MGLLARDTRAVPAVATQGAPARWEPQRTFDELGRPLHALTFCVVDASGISSALSAAVSEKHIGARSLGVRALSPAEPRDNCDLLYLSSSAVGTEDPPGGRTGAAVLTISDAHGFARHGGMIEMFSEGNRIRFNINAENARRAGLRISSNLLRLATKVE